MKVERILDVNINRAAEALRVLEDFARYGLNEAALWRELRELRRRLRATTAGWVLDAARDVGRDVGRSPSLSRSPSRRELESVLRSAFKRLQEAARGLDDYASLRGKARTFFSRLRYRAYELEPALMARAVPRLRLEPALLYVLLDPAWGTASLEETARGALEGGARLLQLRCKEWTDRRVLRTARRVRRLCDEHGALLILNDRADLACAAQADGVHLGRDELSVPQARRILGPTAIVGRTSHTLRESLQAQKEGADYVSVGPVFPTEVKPRLRAGGLAFVRRAAKRLHLPFYAIGGIEKGNLREVRKAGARRVAVCRAVMAARSPRAAARALKRALQ